MSLTMQKKLSDVVLNSYLKSLKKHGDDVFYKKVVGLAFIRKADEVSASPHVELLELSECFFKLARRTGEGVYFDIAKILRRAGHAVYRELVRQNKAEKDARFLSICKKELT
jgi:hypothetical protein